MLLKSYIIYRYLESPKPQKPWKTKKKQSQKSWGRLGNPKNKTLRRMSGFDSKDFLFVFPRFCLFLVGFNSQPWVFLHTYYQPISQKTKNSSFFLVFGVWNQKKQKQPRENPTKKNNLLSQTNDSPQSFFFVFLVSQASPRLLALFFFVFPRFLWSWWF